jgi:perosamine synthetase
VLVSTLTFIAPANAVRYAGAFPVFDDAEPRYWQIDPQRVADFLAKDCAAQDGRLVNRRTGRPIRAILPVDVLGHPVDADALREIAKRHGLAIVEDATEGLGARYRDRAVGALGDVGCLSFNGNKIITTGGGGMVLTDDADWARRARHLSTQAKEDPVEYVHREVGFNYRLTNVLAALGVAQLELLDSYVERKRRIAARYAEAFADVPGLTPPAEAPWATSSYWLYTVLVDEEKFGMGSRELLRALDGDRIQARPLWQPLHRSAAHADCDRVGGEVADRLNRDALSLPCSVGLEEADQRRVIERVLARAR